MLPSVSRDRSPLRRTTDSSLDTILENTMPSELTQIEMNMAKDMLPEYSGGSKNLAYFIKQAELYVDLLKKPNDNTPFNKLLFEQIKSKLVGEARDLLITSNFTNWAQVKDALLQRFGDPRSEELLVNDLTTCFQTNNESYEAYFERIKYKLQMLLEHVSLRTPNNDIRISKENMYTNQALMTFKSGILEPYCSHLLNLPINTLELALFECRKYDNHKSQISFMNFMRGKAKPNNNSNNSARPNFKQQTHNVRMHYPSFYPQFSNPNFNNFPRANSFAFQNHNTNPSSSQPSSRNNSFPTGPINMPRPLNYPINSPQSAGAKSFQPTPMSTTTRNSFNKQGPTPMSISTRNTFKPNYFKPQSRPTFTSQELFNVENPDQNIDQDQEHLYPNEEHFQEQEYYENYEEPENFPIEASEFAEQT